MADLSDRLDAELTMVVAITCEVTGFGQAELLGERRLAPVANARQLGYMLARKCTIASLPQIARAFQRSDHTTVLSGVDAMERKLQASAELTVQYTAMYQKFVLWQTNTGGNA